MKLNEVEKFLLVVVVVLMALAIGLTIIMLTPAEAEAEETKAYILCNPESYVNIRVIPNKNGIVSARYLCGDEVTLDGKKKGDWMHVVNAHGESPEGWVHRLYVCESCVVVLDEEQKATTNAKNVRVRNGVNGKILKRVKKGTEVRIMVISMDWCLTNKGYIKTECLDWIR